MNSTKLVNVNQENVSVVEITYLSVGVSSRYKQLPQTAGVRV